MNYDWTIAPSILFSLSGGFLHSDSEIVSPLVGKENLTEHAGIQGFATSLRAQAIGLPTVQIVGYQGFGWPTQVPVSFKREVIDGRASVNLIRGRHTFVFGAEYLDHRTFGASLFERPARHVHRPPALSVRKFRHHGRPAIAHARYEPDEELSLHGGHVSPVPLGNVQRIQSRQPEYAQHHSGPR